MNKIIYGFLTVFFLAGLFSCGAVEDKRDKADLSIYMDPEFWKKEALTGIIPFWEHTRDLTNGGYFTDVMYDGTVNPKTGKYFRMISRIVYGFSTAYLLSGDDKYLDYAGWGLDYLTNKGWDRDFGGWNLCISNDVISNNGKNLFDQTYGNLGPIMYYFATGNKNSLSYVEKTHTLIKTKAWDPYYGGYLSEVATNWWVTTRMKSFNAQIDTCSAYLIYYYLATRKPGLLRDLKDIADIARDHMIDPKTGFVGETFYDDWRPYEKMLWVGHNLKTGWVLMRMYQLTGEKKYIAPAERIARVQMKLNWDKRYWGWYFLFNADTPETNNEMKDWWTQTEGNFLMQNLYYTLSNSEYLDNFKKCSFFWDTYLIDHEYGDCFPYSARDGETGTPPKGYPYKSAYHTMEHALFNYLYLSLYIKQKTAGLYFRLSADRAGERHYVKPVESPDVVIKSVEINGKGWYQFNPSECYVILPKGKDMKVHVTLGMKR